MASPLKFGVVGAGRMNQRAHIPNLLAEGCKPVAIFDVGRETAGLVAEHFGIPRVCDSYEELLDITEIDAHAISVPDQFHGAYAIPALEHGRHVFMEKPISTNSDDGRRIVDAAEKSGRVLQIGFQRRHDPATEIAKSIIDEWAATGEMGEPRWMQFVCTGGDWNASPDPLISAGVRVPPEYAGAPFPEWLPEDFVGPFASFNNGRSHGLDLLRYLFGPPEAVVSAHARPVFLMHFRWAGTEVFFIEGRNEGGRWDEYLEIHYDHGWLRFRTPPALHVNVPGKVEIYQAREGIRREIEPPLEWAFRREIQHFLAVIREGAPLSPTPAEAWETVNITEQVFRQAMEMPKALPITGFSG